MTEGKPMTRVLIYGGKTGWIGGLMADLIKKEGESSGFRRALRYSCDSGREV